MNLATHLLAGALSTALIAWTLFSATQTFVLPRSARDRLARFVFLNIRRTFDFFVRRLPTYAQRDHLMALYSPVSLLLLLSFWLALVLLGFMGIFWALGVPTWHQAFLLSGSSLLTLGFASTSGLLLIIASFCEAAIGLILIALLIAYLPTIYSAFSRRESLVSMLEVRAGSPPSAVEMFRRFHRLNRMQKLDELWDQWEPWFVDIEETHTSLGALAFFRSPQPDRSWVTAAGTVLDAASLYNAALDAPRNVQADLCIRAGYLALQRIAAYYKFSFNPHPRPDDPMSVTRAEFDTALDRLAADGIPLKPDRDQAWLDFRGWRVNYDVPLIRLAVLTMAPDAPWSSDEPRRQTARALRMQQIRRAKLSPKGGHAILGGIEIEPKLDNQR